ncbi:uncharacterized protein JCM15063_000600 [Sporobolomyces koalae]|uniref:uncharacterized protein n=1 Tax=Sporobolomyces koalae TaxID=500713 RepID=UPI00318252FF
MTSSTTSSSGGKPMLPDLSPASVQNFLLEMELYFLDRKVTQDPKKIAILGTTIFHHPQLRTWWSSNVLGHLKKSWPAFVLEFRKKAYVKDYIWDVKGKIRRSLQDGQPYSTWSTTLRDLHSTIGSAILPDRDFVEHLLYNMDPELCAFLRAHDVLLNTGLQQNDLTHLSIDSTAIFLGNAHKSNETREPLAEIDYEEFDRVAQAQWEVISTRRFSISEKFSRLSTAPSFRSPSSTVSSTSVPTTNHDVSRSLRSGPLTKLERSYLHATSGCLKCRRTWQQHRAKQCPNPIVPFRVEVPADFVPGQTVTPPRDFRPARGPVVPSSAFVHYYQEEEPIYLDWSTGESDSE